MASQADQIEQLAALVACLYRQPVPGPLGGSMSLAEGLRVQKYGWETGRLAKQVGATPEQVVAWEQGQVRPSTGQTIAWLTAISQAPEQEPAPEPAQA